MPCLQCIDKNINGKSYDEKQVQGWINAVCEDVMHGLSELKKPFKYIGASAFTATATATPALVQRSRPLACRLAAAAVTCVIMQNTGAGIHTEHAGWCDTVNDGEPPCAVHAPRPRAHPC